MHIAAFVFLILLFPAGFVLGFWYAGTIVDRDYVLRDELREKEK